MVRSARVGILLTLLGCATGAPGRARCSVDGDCAAPQICEPGRFCSPSGADWFDVSVEPCGLHVRFSEAHEPGSVGPALVDDILDTLGARVITRLAVS